MTHLTVLCSISSPQFYYCQVVETATPLFITICVVGDSGEMEVNMIVLSLIFLAFVSMNIISNSIKVKRIDEYMNDIEKELSEEFKIIK
jgi:hypothetical protein